MMGSELGGLLLCREPLALAATSLSKVRRRLKIERPLVLEPRLQREV